MSISLTALGRQPKNRRTALRLMGAGAVGAGLLPLLSACDGPTDTGPEEASATGDIGAGNLRIVADGLRFPEGPVPLNDGSVLVVEIERGTLTRIDPDGLVEVIANLGGGPNGAAIGPDGSCYVCNNGGFEWHETEDGLLLPGDQPADYDGGSIQKVDLVTGAVTTLYTEIDGARLRGPNDLVFDGQGGFWFTD
ncbi:MAG: SMP-30/gluconolactonase/LRE family protein, partial [Alphaproteobacteria bacterium]|nr:SMP-30/gluconolactonase/LRE family protein [Alphaproteobacteria bacterium]